MIQNRKNPKISQNFKKEVEVISYPKRKPNEMIIKQPKKQLVFEHPSSKQQPCIQFDMLFSSKL